MARDLAKLLWAPQLPTLVQSCVRAGPAALGKARERILFLQLCLLVLSPVRAAPEPADPKENLNRWPGKSV